MCGEGRRLGAILVKAAANQGKGVTSFTPANHCNRDPYYSPGVSKYKTQAQERKNSRSLKPG